VSLITFRFGFSSSTPRRAAPHILESASLAQQFEAHLFGRASEACSQSTAQKADTISPVPFATFVEETGQSSY